MLKVLATLAMAIWGITVMAAEVEEPGFDLLDQFGAVEIRRYESVIQVQTTLESSDGTTSGFQRLAGYIFGGNEKGMEIAMTAPVQETLNTARPTMAFTMPGQYSMEDLPRPTTQDVSLREIPGKTVAVIRFSGWATESRIESKTEQLLAELEQRAIQTVGELSLNQYNPPWTLPFLRRNEVMVEIRGQLSDDAESEHRVGHFLETRDIGAAHVVDAIAAGDTAVLDTAVVDVLHQFHQQRL